MTKTPQGHNDAVARQRMAERRHEQNPRDGLGMVWLIRKLQMHHAETSLATSRLAEVASVGVVLPGGIARDIAPLVDDRHVELPDLGAGLLADLADLDVVVLRAFAAERFQVAADRKDDVLLVLGQLVEDRLRHHQRLQHEPVGRASSRRNEIRLVEEVIPASQAPVCIAA